VQPGVSVNIVKSATRNASLVIAQVNPNMRGRSECSIHANDIDVLVPSQAAIWKCRRLKSRDDPADREYIAALVETVLHH